MSRTGGCIAQPEATPQPNSENNAQLHLLFIGEGENFDSVKEIVKQKQLEHHIFFAGHSENVQEILAGSDLFLLGSTIEGVPGVVLEAGIQGVSSVAVRVGGVGEVVINRETGILIEKHDVTEFSNAVIMLLSDATLRNSLGEKAKAFVMKNYSLQYCTQQFEDLYAAIFNEKNLLQ